MSIIWFYCGYWPQLFMPILYSDRIFLYFFPAQLPPNYFSFIYVEKNKINYWINFFFYVLNKTCLSIQRQWCKLFQQYKFTLSTNPQWIWIFLFSIWVGGIIISMPFDTWLFIFVLFFFNPLYFFLINIEWWLKNYSWIIDIGVYEFTEAINHDIFPSIFHPFLFLKNYIQKFQLSSMHIIYILFIDYLYTLDKIFSIKITCVYFFFRWK